MKYEVLCVGDKRPVKLFDEAQDAAKWVANNKGYYDSPLRIVPRAETIIEQMKDKKFCEIPNTRFLNERIRKDKPDTIFVPDEKEIKEIPFDSWLNKYTGDKAHRDIIEDECHVFWRQIKINFAKTAEEIIWVYKHGPLSCTTTGSRERGLDPKNPHPLTVIGDSAIQVAYVLSRAGKRVAYRTLVCPEKMIHHSGYTNHAQNLGEEAPKALKKLGYKQDYDANAWLGLRVNRIPLVENPKRFLIPALDIIYNLNYWVSDFGDHLQLGVLPGKPHYYCYCAYGYAAVK